MLFFKFKFISVIAFEVSVKFFKTTITNYKYIYIYITVLL